MRTRLLVGHSTLTLSFSWKLLSTHHVVNLVKPVSLCSPSTPLSARIFFSGGSAILLYCDVLTGTKPRTYLFTCTENGCKIFNNLVGSYINLRRCAPRSDVFAGLLIAVHVGMHRTYIMLLTWSGAGISLVHACSSLGKPAWKSLDLIWQNVNTHAQHIQQRYYWSPLQLLYIDNQAFLKSFLCRMMPTKCNDQSTLQNFTDREPSKVIHLIGQMQRTTNHSRAFNIKHVCANGEQSYEILLVPCKYKTINL